jgi:hypothetical protein
VFIAVRMRTPSAHKLWVLSQFDCDIIARSIERYASRGSNLLITGLVFITPEIRPVARTLFCSQAARFVALATATTESEVRPPG